MVGRCFFIFLAGVMGCLACSRDDSAEPGPTPQPLQIPALFANLLPPPHIPGDNPQTAEGVALGQKLFFDPILSGDGTQSCSSCHMPAFSFDDSVRFSTGIDGLQGTRNAMPLINLAWNRDQLFFWDGRAGGLEAQALEPVVNPIEMHHKWPEAVADLQAHPGYPGLFEAAFGTSVIDSILVARALAQFERTLISADSRFDRHLLGELQLTMQEMRGLQVFMAEDKGDCFHCHGNPQSPLWTDHRFHNNGLDANPQDPGLAGVTGNPADHGKFKTPTLRNLAFTAPYMHDGRFATLEEVIDHYSEGLQFSPTIDPLMKKVDQGGVRLSPQDKEDLRVFLLSLGDSGFVQVP